jgi:hypothetical protein
VSKPFVCGFEQILTTENTEHAEARTVVDFSAASVTSAVNGLKKFAIARCLFEQLPQILKHGVFFVGVRAIGDKELLA